MRRVFGDPCTLKSRISRTIFHTRKQSVSALTSGSKVMRSLRQATSALAEVAASRLASHSSASCSSQWSQPARIWSDRLTSGCTQCARAYASGVDYSQAPPGGVAGNTKVKSDDQPGESPEGELARVRAKRLLRTEKPNYLDNGDFEDELKYQSILVEPDVPVYDLPEVMQQIGYPLVPSTPLFDQIKDLPLDHPDVQTLLCMEPQEEQPPYPGARQILQWEQRLVLSVGDTTGDHPVNKKAKCTLYLRDLQEQTGLSDEALQLIARVCGSRYDQTTGKLTLISEKYNVREENRRHIVEMLAALVSEGHKAFPVTDPALLAKAPLQRMSQSQQ